jgi:heptaprenylglyceryl phosphate synthase
MKPGLAAAVVSQVRMANALPLMESVIALALAYSAKLGEFPTMMNSPTQYWITNYSSVASELISAINEEQFMQVELVLTQAREAYVSRVQTAYKPNLHGSIDLITAGWDANAWVAYHAIHAIFAAEFGTPSEA